MNPNFSPFITIVFLSVASNSTEIDGDERLQIGHYVAGFNLSLIGKEFNFDSSDLGKVHLI